MAAQEVVAAEEVIAVGTKAAVVVPTGNCADVEVARTVAVVMAAMEALVEEAVTVGAGFGAEAAKVAAEPAAVVPTATEAQAVDGAAMEEARARCEVEGAGWLADSAAASPDRAVEEQAVADLGGEALAVEATEAVEMAPARREETEEEKVAVWAHTKAE